MTAVFAISLILAATANPSSLTFKNSDEGGKDVVLSSLVPGKLYDIAASVTTSSNINRSKNYKTILCMYSM